ncbi:MAG: hypothetical protein IT196_14245 [Acidimicrobiales bacterium]|nr:hypothetical protein [Acidimicrobiales bacterium]
MFDSVRAQLTALELDPFDIPAPASELPFFEAYFSNYIEGTEFIVEDARTIVDTQRPPARPQNATCSSSFHSGQA